MMRNGVPDGNDPLIRASGLEVYSPPCRPGADVWSARVILDGDIGHLLPYLNAVLEGAVYYHAARTLTWKSEGRSFSFQCRRIDLAPVADREEARQAAEEIIRLINDIAGRRDQIEPSIERRTKPDLMAIFRLLPRSNCGDCGSPTCMAFAAGLREGRALPEECPALKEEPRAGEYAALRRLLGLS